MRRTFTLAALAVAVSTLVAPLAAAKMDAKERLVDGVKQAVKDQHNVLNALKQDFRPKTFIQGSGARARQQAIDVDDDLKAAHAELVGVVLAIPDYLKATQNLDEQQRQQAKDRTGTLRKQLNKIKDLDLAAWKVPLERDVGAYADDTSSKQRKAKVRADAQEIRQDIERALELSGPAQATAESVPNIVVYTRGSGYIITNPNSTPDNPSPEQFRTNFAFDGQLISQAGAYSVVLPFGYVLQGFEDAPGYSCSARTNDSAECEWQGSPDPSPAGPEATPKNLFGTNPPLALGDRVMACYGISPPAWRNPPPAPRCFFLSGT